MIKMKYKIIKILICMIFIGLISIQVNSIGISPSRIIVPFEPNMEKSFTYYILNREDTTTNVQIYTTGEFSDYVTLYETSMKIGPGETGQFTIDFKMPSFITEPGTYDTRIGVVEIVGGNGIGAGSSVGAVTGVESQLYIRVPYPGKYISTRLEIGKLVVNEPMIFKIIVDSLGKEDIDSLSGIIKVYDPEKNEITKLDTDIKNLKAGETTELYAKWTPKDLRPGVYKAVAVVNYDGKISETESEFNIGDLLIEVVNISQKTFEQGKINKFDIGIQSLWNEIIDNIYAEIKVYDNNKNIISEFKTENTDVRPWSFKDINAYWDTTNVPIGTYNANIILNYRGKQSQENFEFNVVKSSGLNVIYLIIGGLASVIILLIIFILIIYLKYKKGVKNE